MPVAGRVPTITAFKDSKGRLKITNDPPALALGPPTAKGGAVAPAALEPFITEAALAYGCRPHSSEPSSRWNRTSVPGPYPPRGPWA